MDLASIRHQLQPFSLEILDKITYETREILELKPLLVQTLQHCQFECNNRV